ncbi:unnamed protein product [Prunus armeniaca]|uniref:Uncharacterized protein n=1 Tax=Prunus armeniaca TaxID=36596 RepID=A0A6J5UF95_PRUAR|nr:unnamed protein product [Prunus armeniaca]
MDHDQIIHVDFPTDILCSCCTAETPEEGLEANSLGGELGDALSATSEAASFASFPKLGAFSTAAEKDDLLVVGLTSLGALEEALDDVVSFGSKIGFICGSTLPLAMVTPFKSFSSSSSFFTANSTCRGLIQVFLLSRAAFPSNSRT